MNGTFGILHNCLADCSTFHLRHHSPEYIAQCYLRRKGLLPTPPPTMGATSPWESFRNDPIGVAAGSGLKTVVGIPTGAVSMLGIRNPNQVLQAAGPVAKFVSESAGGALGMGLPGHNRVVARQQVGQAAKRLGDSLASNPVGTAQAIDDMKTRGVAAPGTIVISG